MFAELKPVIFIDDDAGDIVDDAFRSLSLDGADDKCGCAEPLLTPVAAQIETDRAQGIRVGKNQRLQRGLELLLLDVVLMLQLFLGLPFRRQIRDDVIEEQGAVCSFYGLRCQPQPSPPAVQAGVAERHALMAAGILDILHMNILPADIFRMNPL